jgi:hypothetical protein
MGVRRADADPEARNTAEQPDRVTPHPATGTTVTDGMLRAELDRAAFLEHVPAVASALLTRLTGYARPGRSDAGGTTKDLMVRAGQSARSDPALRARRAHRLREHRMRDQDHVVVSAFRSAPLPWGWVTMATVPRPPAARGRQASPASHITNRQRRDIRGVILRTVWCLSDKGRLHMRHHHPWRSEIHAPAEPGRP